MARPRTHSYKHIAFRVVPLPVDPDPLMTMLDAVKKLPTDRALAVSCPREQMDLVRGRVYGLGETKPFKHHDIHTRETAAGQFVVWITPRAKRGRKEGK